MPRLAPLMTAGQFVRALEELELSQVGAGRFLGLTDRAVRRYVAGDTDVPDTVAILLRVMLAKRISVEQARKIAGRRRHE